MELIHALYELQDVMRAVITQKKLDARQWSRQELIRHQQQKLSLLVRHAGRHSPFYAQLYGNINIKEDITLNSLPVINKATMMENFDAFVTDPRLKLSDLRTHISQLARRDEYYLREYRVLTTSGSSGLKGVFVFNRKEWSTAIAEHLRCGAWMRVKPRLPRWKMASVIAGSPMHTSYRVSASSDVGLVKVKRFEATTPLNTLVDALNAYQPECFGGYPSMAALLAVEQLEGRLHIHPSVAATAGELLTEDMSQKIKAAWGSVPYNFYGLTEAGVFLGADCSCHQGIHVFEDLFIVEVVDDNNKPLPENAVGGKFLITNLFNFTQPLIRYEISDMISMTSDACPCGHPFKRIVIMEGRNDDIIYLPGADGTDVRVHPLNFRSPLAAVSQIKEYQIVHETDGIDVFIVLRPGSSGDQVANAIKKKLEGKIESLGARCPEIRIKPVPQLNRDGRKMGKLRLVISNVKKDRSPR